ncbi:ABC transporter permease [Ferroacidibacillus organovorans]|uniref:ABC transporter n=1 Tax=Ferroacidibacillus organovorans TaxID=1765683 RepID=A0A162SIP2_9BACL|nr:ABC transporter permease [Ferroacidibacillus organovorans]KYP79865.1 ABC transporter [Ferroacidibacillus organovorans]OAG93426.1 ABC transporter [Ferroacidibacillus organovorans]OPG16289.1 ABC transporter [Ferroacidibacillus organovorans]
MMKFLVRRILEAIPTVLGVTILSFVLIHIVPGSPVRILLGNHYTPLRAAELTRSLGLNKPLVGQYLIWMGNLLHGNFGYSYTYDKPVVQLLLQALPHTIVIVVFAVLAAHVFAVFLGSVQAYFENTKFDQIVTFINYFFYSMPTFWLAVLLVIFFSIDLNWFPSGGIVNTQLSNPGFGDWLKHLILPTSALFLVSVAGWARYMRSSMREALLQDYVRTARMKGASEFRVIFVHALRNSILPLITLFGLSLPILLSGALFVEEVFNYPGMGLLYWDAVNSRDYPIIMGITVFIGLVTVIGNLISDILYGLIDPRIQYL